MKLSNCLRDAAGCVLVLKLCLAIWVLPIAAQNPDFLQAAKKRIQKEFRDSRHEGLSLADVCSIDNDPLARRVFWEYGSIFVADGDVQLPETCVFTSSALVDAFQARLETRREVFGTVEIELQESAMEHLMKAVKEAAKLRLSITPLDGAIAGRRNYDDTVRLWNSRFHRALDHWMLRGKITKVDGVAARNLPLDLQVRRVIEWEGNGLFFSTNFSKSIFYSVAPPGTSQHLSLLAFDVVEADDQRVRAIMNKHGWYQTIRTDKPHFTFLGLHESELPGRGLRNIYHEGNPYWVPSTEPLVPVAASR